MDLFLEEMSSDGRVLIVGGGPAGSLSALLIGSHNPDLEVVLCEEHQTAGFPVQCAGLISGNCFEAYSRYCKIKRAVENEIKGAFFFSPSGKFLEVGGEAFVVERRILDAMLLRKASEKAEVMIKSKVSFSGGKAKVGGKTIEWDYLIGADGCYSVVARTFGFERYDIYPSLQIEAKFEAMDENFVELYFGRDYSNGFFAYSIPVGDTAKIGVVSRDNPKDYLKNLLEKHPAVKERVGRSVVEVNAGCIPAKLINFVKGRIALIGDSAGMVKPYTGGGLYYLLRAAEILAESFPNLASYRKRYMKEFGREYEIGEKIRRLYSSLRDEEYDRLIELFKDFDFSKLDMDRPSTLRIASVVLKLASNPRMALKLLRNFLS